MRYDNESKPPLPMDNNSTHIRLKKRLCRAVAPTYQDASNDMAKETSQQPAPSVIAFIRQFARCYSYEPQLPGQLGGMVAN